jgi:5-dehydro-2-deoxygluconokinase
LVIGRAGMDLYADPPGTALEIAQNFTSALGGSSANIAAALSRQGVQAGMVTCVSDDAVGRFVEAQLDAYGIDRTHVRRVKGEARNTLAIVDTCGVATQAVLYRNGAADFEMSDADLAGVDLAQWSAVVTTGTVLAAEPARSATLRLFERARAAGVPLILDVDYRPYSWVSRDEAATVCTAAAALCDIVIGNDEEFAVLGGAPSRALPAARALLNGPARIVVFKMGGEGAITLTPDAEIRSGIFRTEALKPTGAGDSFMGGFLAALCQGRPVDEAVLRGSASAAIVVARVGCAPACPTTPELDAFMAAHPGPTQP